MGKAKLISQYCLTLTAEGVHIDGHCGIEEYGTELITVRVKSKLITLRGTKLKLAAMDKDELLITGSVQDIELTGIGRSKN